MSDELQRLITEHIEEGENIISKVDEYCDVVVGEQIGLGAFLACFEHMLGAMGALRTRGAVGERLGLFQAITAIPLRLHEERSRRALESAELALQIPEIADNRDLFPYWVNRVLAYLTDAAGKREARDYALRLVEAYENINEVLQRLLRLYVFTPPRSAAFVAAPAGPSSTFTHQLRVPARNAPGMARQLLFGPEGRCPTCGYRLCQAAESGECLRCMRMREQARPGAWGAGARGAGAGAGPSAAANANAAGAGTGPGAAAAQGPGEIHCARDYAPLAEDWELSGRQWDSRTGIAVLTAEELAE